jgi:hypothetical protein
MGGLLIAVEIIAIRARPQKGQALFLLIADRQHGSEIQSIAAPLVLGAAEMSIAGDNQCFRLSIHGLNLVLEFRA